MRGLTSASRKDKVRIIALYVMHRDGVPEEDRKRLYQHAKLGPPEMDAVNNLAHLGQDVTRDAKSKRKAVFKQPVVEDAYDISRYQPAVKLMVEVRAGPRRRTESEPAHRSTFPASSIATSFPTSAPRPPRPPARHRCEAAPRRRRRRRPRSAAPDRGGRTPPAPGAGRRSPSPGSASSSLSPAG
jgi:syntaxin-binding protein 1